MSDESVHSDAVHAAFVHNEEKRKEYRREWMKKKREEEKAHKEQDEDRKGGVDASEAPVEVVIPERATMRLTKTDEKFEDQRPGYWIYGIEVIKRECWKCGDKFETRLEMNKFCSPQCKEKWLSDAFGKLRSQEKSTVGDLR